MGFITRTGIFVWLVILFASCSDDSSFTEGGVIKGEVVIQSGVPQRINNQILLEIIDIHDSRCPVGVVCSSAGNVDITFEVYSNGTSFTHKIKYCELDELSSDTIEGTVLDIVDVSPSRFAEDKIELEDYRVTIDVLE